MNHVPKKLVSIHQQALDFYFLFKDIKCRKNEYFRYRGEDWGVFVETMNTILDGFPYFSRQTKKYMTGEERKEHKASTTCYLCRRNLIRI